MSSRQEPRAGSARAESARHRTRQWPRQRGGSAACAVGLALARTSSLYAVAPFHAEKGETTLRTGLFGQPEEGYGFSRNATGTMGPPSFNAAAYNYPGGASTWPVAIIYP